jgi:hypothetical protein
MFLVSSDTTTPAPQSPPAPGAAAKTLACCAPAGLTSRASSHSPSTPVVACSPPGAVRHQAADPAVCPWLDTTDLHTDSRLSEMPCRSVAPPAAERATPSCGRPPSSTGDHASTDSRVGQGGFQSDRGCRRRPGISARSPGCGGTDRGIPAPPYRPSCAARAAGWRLRGTGSDQYRASIPTDLRSTCWHHSHRHRPGGAVVTEYRMRRGHEPRQPRDRTPGSSPLRWPAWLSSPTWRPA